MVKIKKKAKKKAGKRLTPLQQIRKQLDKLEALHEKEEAIVDKITDIIDDEQDHSVLDEWR